MKVLFGVAALCPLFAFAGQASAAETCPNEAIREEQHSTSLPECRAYEQVSPVDKGGMDAGVESFQGAHSSDVVVSPGGNRVIYSSLTAPPGDLQGWDVADAATRGPGGWVFQGMLGEYGPVLDGEIQKPNTFYGYSEDLRTGLYSDYTQATHSVTFYLQRANGSRALVTSGHSPVGLGDTVCARALSADGRHALFISEEPLTTIPGGVSTVGSTVLYEWEDNGAQGTLRIVNLANDGSLINPEAGPGQTSGGADLGRDTGGGSGSTRQCAIAWPVGMRNAISANGERVFFQAPPGVGQLYLREDASKTTEVSAPEAGLPAATAVGYLGATRDGSKVWFEANAPLTSEAPEGSNTALYQYDVDTQTLTWITTLPSGHGFSEEGFMPADQGGRIYYTTYHREVGQIANFSDLYTWDGSGPPTLVFQGATEGEGPASNGREGLRDYEAPSADLTADGRYLVFSIERHPFGAHPASLKSEIYRYDAQTGVTQDITAIPGEPPFSFHPELSGEVSRVRLNLVHEMSRDGLTVFFDTDAPMVPTDTNRGRDVYEWHDGKTSLISAGTGPDESLFSGLDSTPGGVNAIFWTRDALVSQDGDLLGDFYDARTDGGYPQPPAAPTCSGDACQGRSGAVPGQLPPASSRFPGRGNAGSSRGRHVTLRVFKLGAARGASVRVRVRAPGAGVIGVFGRVLRPSRKAVKRAGAYTVIARLAGSARHRLRQGHAVRVSIIVRFNPTAGRSSLVRAHVTVEPRRRRQRRPSSHRSRQANVPSTISRKGR